MGPRGFFVYVDMIRVPTEFLTSQSNFKVGALTLGVLSNHFSASMAKTRIFRAGLLSTV